MLIVSILLFMTVETGTGEKYIRWGRTTCESMSTLLYSGFAAGNRFNEAGSGNNFLCLPKDPDWKLYSEGLEAWRGRLYGVEYEIDGNWPPFAGFHNKDMPCAVCLITRSTVLMIPGKANCYSGLHKEYSGYLMSQASYNDGRMPSQYICVDEKPESVPGSDDDHNQAVVYPVEVVCGSLKCPPYVSGRQLTCVVCSK